MSAVKDAAREIIEKLPEQAGWDDLIYELYVRQKVDAGLAAVADGDTIPHDQIRERVMGDKSGTK